MNDRLKSISDPSQIAAKDGVGDLYIRLLDNMYDGIGLFELCGNKIRAVYLNERYFKMIGYTKEEYLPYLDNITVTLFEDDEARLLEDVHRMHKTDSIFSVEVRGYRSDHSTAWFCLRGRPVDFVDSENPVFLASIFDCSREKELEHNLRLNKERYKILEEISGNYLFDYNPESDEMIFSPGRDTEEKHIGSYSRYLRGTDKLDPIDMTYFYFDILRCSTKKRRSTVSIRCPDDKSAGFMVCSLSYMSIVDEYDSIIRVLGHIEITDRCAQFPENPNECMREKGQFGLSADDFIGKVNSRLAAAPAQAAVIMIDIDDMDGTNQAYGFENCNDALKQFADLLQSVFGEGLLFSYLACTFGLYMENVTEKDIYYSLDKLRQAADSVHIPLKFSAGAAWADSDTEKMIYKDFAVTAARALYMAKTDGGSMFRAEKINADI